MESTDMLNKMMEICEDRKAEDIITYDVREKSVLADYYLLCSGNSIAHIRAIVHHLEKAFKDLGILPRSIEGAPTSRWIIMDYNDVLVHLFHHEVRAYYNIEELLNRSLQRYSGNNLN